MALDTNPGSGRIFKLTDCEHCLLHYTYFCGVIFSFKHWVICCNTFISKPWLLGKFSKRDVKYSGPSCSKLTMSLVNVSLNL